MLKKSALVKIPAGVLLLLLITVVLLYVIKLIEPSSLPQNLLVTNITDHQASISWTTAKPTRGLIIISENNKFPLVPIWAKKIYHDDGEKLLGSSRFYTTHLITVDNLAPSKTYQYLIYQDWKKIVQGSFTTGPILSSLAAPNPVYGRVVNKDKKGAAGVLVHLQVLQKLKNKTTSALYRSALLTALTNQDGRWSLDLANLRTANLKNSYKIASSAAEILIVQTKDQRLSAESKPGQDKPWVDVVVNNQVQSSKFKVQK